MPKKFEIPTIAQVSAFMANERPEWPKSFCDWYADKFWHTYNEGGWKLSRNIPMKNWQSAFHNRWKEIRYEDIRKKLSECLKTDSSRPKQQEIYNSPASQEKAPEKNPNAVWDYMDDILSQYRINKPHISPDLRESMAGIYKWLKTEKILRFTEDEVKKLVADSGNDKSYGRYLSVKLLFEKLITNQKTFKDAFSTAVAAQPGS